MHHSVTRFATLAVALLLSAAVAGAADQKAPAAKPAPAAPAAPAAKAAPATPAMPAAPAAKEELLDINSATDEQLKKIPGIGDEYAKKIIAGRPYAKKDQLKTKKVIPGLLYDKIKDRIVAKQAKAEPKK